MRLIDADEILMDAEHMSAFRCSLANMVVLAILVASQKTVDAVPVVRCKDCKYMTQWAYGRYCTVWDGVNGMGDDGFCNYGERKGGGNND